MKLFLHIGTEKTGSTSLQAWLAHHDKALVQAGVFYSEALGRQDNRWISVYARDSDKPDDGFDRAGISNPEEHARFRTRIEADLAREVQQARDLGCKAFVVSSEHLHSRVTSPEMVARVKALCAPLFSDIEVVCYLRPQAQLMQSRIAVGVRNASVGPHELKTYLARDYFDYFDLYTRWADQFETCSFLSFQKRKDVVEDFARVLDVSLDQFPRLPRTNEKLDYRAGLVGFNLQETQIARSVPKQFLRMNIETLLCKEPIRISRSLATIIQKRYRISNKALVAKAPDLTLADLEGSLDSFPIEGNAERMLEHWEGAELMADMVLHLNADVKINRIQTLLAEAELSFTRNADAIGRQRLTRAGEILADLKRVDALSKRPELKRLTRRIEDLKHKFAEQV